MVRLFTVISSLPLLGVIFTLVSLMGDCSSLADWNCLNLSGEKLVDFDMIRQTLKACNLHLIHVLGL